MKINLEVCDEIQASHEIRTPNTSRSVYNNAQVEARSTNGTKREKRQVIKREVKSDKVTIIRFSERILHKLRRGNCEGIIIIN